MINPDDVVAYGRAASEALGRTIARAQAADPLAPVCVIVPSNFVGLSARRLLGSALLESGGRHGVANVRFVTPFQLAELVAADLLLDTRPLTNPVLAAAVRHTLKHEPSPFAPVAEHEATVTALAGMFAELSNVDEAGLEAIEDEGSESAQLVVGLYRAIAARLSGFHTEHDLARAASERPDLAERLGPFGHVIWYLPAPLTAALAQFIGRVLGDASACSVIIGVTGAAAADEPVWRSCEAAGVVRPDRGHESGLPAVSGSTGAPVTCDVIVSVTDAAEEVRELCSRVLTHLEAGVAPDRIGVFYPTADPYVRIIEHQFDAAGIVVNGPDRRRLADSVAGRTVLGALELPNEGWRRDRVIALVSGGPVRAGDEFARPTAWDKLSRDAGVVTDLADWRKKLHRYEAATQLRLDRIDQAGSEAEAQWADQLAGQLGHARRLAEFVDRLAELVAGVSAASTWHDKSVAASTLLRELLGADHQLSTWPESEQDAFGRVEDALVRLGALDSIEPSPSQTVFVRALGAELDVARGRRGRFGHGVMFGPISAAVGHDLDVVFVLGAAEGLLPVPRRDDAILPERVRINALDQLESKSARLHHQHRAFLAALSAAPAGGRTILFPRGDLRSNRRALPSRWLLDSASALAGSAVHATDFAELGGGIVDVVGAHASGIRRPGPATSLQERDMVAFARLLEDGVDVVEQPLAALAGHGLEMQRARSSGHFTIFDGNLGSVLDSSAAGNALPMSPTRLQTWAACGFRYFLSHVLGLADRDDPERTDDISALDRGSLIHRTLERFIGEAIAAGAPPPDVAWSAEDRRRLHEIADEVCREYEEMGRTGRTVNWRVRRDEIDDLLDTFVAADNNFRRSARATPTAVELDFGVRTGSPVRITLPDNTELSLHGLADRVDTTDDGRVIVSDYKSGKGAHYDKLDDDPFVAGTTLQLGMYAEGALQHTGAAVAQAAYWLVEAGGNERRGYTWTPELRERFDEVLTAISTGIRAGVFAATPGEWNTWRQTNEACTYCEFDTVCLRNRGEQADVKAAAPELRVRSVLVADDDEGSAS